VVSALAGMVERKLLVVRSGDGDAVEGAQALARRHAILARLETRPTAEAVTAATSIDAAPIPEQPQPVREETVVPDVAGADVHLVADTRGPVIPPRPEPFIPQRRPDFPDEGPRPVMVAAGGAGAAVAASGEPVSDAVAEHAQMHIERDPSVNKSLLLRLIAGVRGL
jgi:hypothetical protein